MTSAEPPSFQRGGGGPPQPLPKGAGVLLVAISVVTLVAMLGMLAWLLM